MRVGASVILKVDTAVDGSTVTIIGGTVHTTVTPFTGSMVVGAED